MPQRFGTLLHDAGATMGIGVAGNDDANGRHYDGIDVSHHQGQIDWLTVGKDPSLQFVYIKSTEGSTHVDPLYTRNLRGAMAAGLKIGTYHFLTSSSSVHAQFAHFMQTIDLRQQDLLPMVDIEWNGVRGWKARQIRDSLAVFAWLVKKACGRYPMLYADARFYNTYLSPRFDKFPLFIARYHDDAPQVKGLHRHYVWQYDTHGSIEGIGHEVDLDAFAEGTTIDDILLPKPQSK